MPNQTSATIARLLVEKIVSRHGVPSEILSDRGRAFLSGLMRELETVGFPQGEHLGVSSTDRRPGQEV